MKPCSKMYKYMILYAFKCLACWYKVYKYIWKFPKKMGCFRKIFIFNWMQINLDALMDLYMCNLVLFPNMIDMTFAMLLYLTIKVFVRTSS